MKLLTAMNSKGIIFKVVSSLAFCFFALMPVSADELTVEVRKGDCLPAIADGSSTARILGQRRLPEVRNEWDANRTYKQMVVLVSFSDRDFAFEKPQETYDSIFNTSGYNQGLGAGCVADYFRDQSQGMFNLSFDVFGPIKASTKAQPYDNPNENTRNYGVATMKEAIQQIVTDNPDYNFAQYDWDNNGSIEQVIFVFAGYAGNTSSTKSYGHVWPNTSSFSSITMPGNVKVSNYSTSCELWTNDRSCGIGTICHEYSHSLGLPDIYPVQGNVFSAVDEWDLMDGGNFTNYGWCPPNYTALEKMLLGWVTPTELDSPVTISGLIPSNQGGQVYQIKHTDNEYLLLENRQWNGWDAGLPGKGLVVYHVDYSSSLWKSNAVNNDANHFRFAIVTADNMDYDQWQTLLIERGVRKQNDVYQNVERMNSHIMSSAAYPLDTDSTFNNELTDTSVPSALMFNDNALGSKNLSKPITKIVMHDDGTVSFDFMGGSDTAVAQAEINGSFTATVVEEFDLSGRRQPVVSSRGIRLQRMTDGSVRKVLR